MFGLAKTEFWYNKLPNDHPLVTNGYLSKVTFFNQTPPPSYALRINAQKAPLDDLNVRLGIHHSMNFQLVMDKIFRGDFVRMNTVADGYGRRSHPTLRARDFSVDKAVRFFAGSNYATCSGESSDRVPPRSQGFQCLPRTSVCRSRSRWCHCRLRQVGCLLTTWPS